MADNETTIIDKKQKLLLEHLFNDYEVFIKAHGILSPDYFDPPLNRVVKYVKSYFGQYHSLPSMDAIEAETDILPTRATSKNV